MARRRISLLIKNCSINGIIHGGIQLHGVVIKLGLDSDTAIGNYLLDMYAKCGELSFARKVFEEMRDKNVVSWTTVMVGLLAHGDAIECLKMFSNMGCSGVEPNEFTLSTALKACAYIGIVENGMQIHGVCAKNGYELHDVVSNSIIIMYSRNGRVKEGKQMFDVVPRRTLATWNAMIAGFAYEGKGKNSLQLFKEMQGEGIFPDEYTFASLLKACSSLGASNEGVQLHASLVKNSLNDYENAILSGALLDLYVRCENLNEARKVFDLARQKNVILWTTLIAGYTQHGQMKEALGLFSQFWSSGIEMDGYVLSSMIGFFADFALIEQGKQMHSYAIKSPSGLDISVGNSIINMYLKCGFTEEAELHFRTMEKKNVVSWTAMINGYGKHGNGRTAIDLFIEMQNEGINPDEVSYLALLSACSHSRLIEECRHYFARLLCDDRVKPKVEHYACMVDLLGRAGKLEEAKELIKTMPLQPNTGIWQTLLSACRVHKNMDMGREVGNVLLRMDGDNPANYIMLSNIFADAGQWKECENLRVMMKNNGLKKQGGWSSVEINKEVHVFYGNDATHPLTAEIHKVLKEVERRMKEELGYVSRAKFAMHDIDDESKEESLMVHSERLAIGLWLVCCKGLEKAEGVVRVYKNLRVCVDCHEFIKRVSSVTARMLVVRDANRFHRFENGECSCRDYW